MTARIAVEGYEGSFVGQDDPSILQPDEGDEEADACRDSEAEVLRDTAYDLLADVEGGEQDEDDPFDEDGCETSLPAVAHAHNEGEGEEGIDTHAGSLGEGQLS